jgi:hypothetical protein
MVDNALPFKLPITSFANKCGYNSTEICHGFTNREPGYYHNPSDE